MSDLALEVRGLTAGFEMGGRLVPVIEDVDLVVRKGEFLGLIGESGSGKTVTGMSLLRLLPENTVTTAVTLDFQGVRLLDLDDEQFRALRGNRLAMVFQDPTGAFNPAKRIGWHLRQVLNRVAAKSPAHAARSRDWHATAVALLREVGIVHGAEVLGQYPHQLSGGMLQRALIALVLAFEPDLIVADEPTTNLDNIVERQILRLFRRLQKRLHSAFIFITHDMSIAASLCDRIAVMYAGRIVEMGDTASVFRDPKHPYTRGLLATALALEGSGERLQEIPGELPPPGAWPAGCLFAPRCPQVTDACLAARPHMRRVAGREVRCVLYEDADA